MKFFKVLIPIVFLLCCFNSYAFDRLLDASIVIYQTGQPSNSFASDLNGDGKDDLILVYGANNQFSISMANDETLFDLPVFYNTIHEVSGVTAADLDNDNDNDVVVTINNYNSHPDTVLIFSNDGNGNLYAPTIIAAGNYTSDIIAADIDNDNDIDLVIANEVSALAEIDISILYNNGDGTFQSPIDFGSYGNPSKVVALDLDADNYLDLATINLDDYGVGVFLNNGDGTFTGTDFFPIAARPVGLDGGDIDGDFDNDLVIGSEDATVLLFHNNGDATFGAPIGIAANSNARPTLIDVDSDGDLDMITANSSDDNLTIYSNDGLGNFVQTSLHATADNPQVLVTGDFDGEGNVDFATANLSDYSVSVFLNKGDGTYPEVAGVNGGPNPTSIISADFSKNGFDDFAVGNVYLNDTAFNVVLNAGMAGFSVPESYVHSGAGLSQAITAADFDGNGNIDLAVVNDYLTKSVAIFLSYAPGEFEPVSEVLLGHEASDVFSIDIDSDNDFDLLIAAEFTAKQFDVYRNDGDGNFSLDTEYDLGAHAFKIYAGDIDGDNDNDVVLALRTTDAVAVMFNDGAGSFSGLQTYAVGDQPRRVVLADIDNDNDLDIATSNYSGSASVLLNNGDGTYQNYTDYSIPLYGTYLVPIDLNSDGFDDIATVGERGALTTLISNGDGTLKTGVSYLIPKRWSYGVTSGDFNADGVQDLAAIATKVWVYTNTTSASYVCGDPDGSGVGGQITDLNILVNYFFRLGTPPIPLISGDFTGDELVNILDLNWVVNYIFRLGPAPVCP